MLLLWKHKKESKKEKEEIKLVTNNYLIVNIFTVLI